MTDRDRESVAKRAEEAASLEQVKGAGMGCAYIVGAVKAMAESVLHTPDEKVEQITLLLEQFDRALAAQKDKAREGLQ